MTPVKTAVQLAIVDDHNLFRKGLIKLINLGDKENKYSVLFEAENGTDLVKKLDKKNLPDIILMDIDMPDMDGFETVAWLKDHYPGINILVVSMIEKEEAVVRMLRLGVKGYLSKDIEVTDMEKALQVISNKGLYISDIIKETITYIIPGIVDRTNGKAHDLTEKEWEFLKLVCTELTYQQIADKMCLSPKTIDGYREALFKKFGVKTRVGLAMYAIKHGLVKL